nr:putative ribonuclease H-like domain-containing protein [Tanacetum cinerariifolium]
MHKAFPLPVMEFSLAEEVPTASEESSHCQKKRDATAEKIALLLKSSSNCQLKSYDSYAKLVPHVSPCILGVAVILTSSPANVATTGTASDETGKKKGSTVTLTADDMQKSKYKNAQELWAAILKTIGADGSETLEQTFNRLQVIVSQLQFIDVEIEQDDLNQKFLTRMAYAHDTKHSSGNEEVNTASVSTTSTNVFTASANIGVATISQDTTCAYIASQSSELLKKEKGELETKLTGFQTASKDLDSLLESQRLDKNKEGLGYSVVPPPLAQIYSFEFKDGIVTDYSRPSPAIESTSDDAQNKNPSVTNTEASPSTILPKPFIKFVKANDSPTKSKTDKVEIAKKPPVKYAEQYRKPTKKPNVRGNQRNWNNLKSHQLGSNFMIKKKACFNCGDFNHFAYDCSKRVKRGTSRSQNNTHKSFTPRHAVHKPYRSPTRPMRSNMNVARPNRTSFNKPAHLYTKRPFQRTSAVRYQYKAPWGPTVNRNFPSVNRKFSTVSRNVSNGKRKFLTANRKFPTGSTKFSTADLGKMENVVKASACWFWKPSQNLSNKGPNRNSVSVMFKKYTYIDTQGRLNSQNNIDDKGYWDNGCSRHMTGNISYLSDYEPFDGGYVSFECIVLERDFKLLDDANVLLRTPRQHNMYSIDLNNIVPHKDLTCLVAKASADEGMLWYRRLGYLNFKTMNRLVRHNLVRGLPSKCFKNDHTCSACLKGKQHKASCKSKLVNSVTKPLHTLHMDLFGPTSVSSISHKRYCLVVTDDFSRFTWTFFLKTKDETSGILRKFIIEIKNLKDLKVKIIMCDNGENLEIRRWMSFVHKKESKESLAMLGLLNRMVLLKGEIEH